MRYTSLPIEDIQAWSHFNGIKLLKTSVESHVLAPDGTDKGGGLLARSDHDLAQPLVSVPFELVLSKARVEECAKADQHLRDLVEAAGPLFQNPRTAVLLFLVYQLTINSPDSTQHGLGFPNPFADYVKFLPKEIPLPTFYSPAERDLLVGTSLGGALDQKLGSLEREFDNLRAATSSIPWCQRAWWDDRTGCLNVEDWKLADALYRSRALELPRGAGVGMVPVVDMANHASDDRYNARFEVDEGSGTVLLVVRDTRPVRQEDEITIMYGVGGACEMVFSYGFLEEHASSAREIFLELAIGSDDPLRMAKVRFAQEAPGVRLYVDDTGRVRWDSTFVWWACVNQEDGLDFRVGKTVAGDTELEALWKDAELRAENLPFLLQQDSRRDVYTLRAVVMIQDRVEDQGMRLAASEAAFEDAGASEEVRPMVHETIGRLRKLELELLARAYEALEEEKTQLLGSQVVHAYLGQGEDRGAGEAGGALAGETPDDFS